MAAYPDFTRPGPGRPNFAGLLADLSKRKEFSVFEPGGAAGPARSLTGFSFKSDPPTVTGLQPTGPQQFIRNIMNPNTDFARILVNWQTGTGKTSAAVGIANEFIRQYRARAALGENAPGVFVIGFTKQIFQTEMLRFPEHGFVSAAEVVELQRLEDSAKNGAIEAKQLSNYLGMLRRRLTDRTKNGYFQFYGYKVFVSRLFAVTPAGARAKFDIACLADPGRLKGAAPGPDLGPDFGTRLVAAVRRGLVTVNTELLDSMRGGLVIVDEVHNVYNIVDKNNYGVAIQYALDALGDDAPRAVFLTATPMTGSAAEIVDLLNLLVPGEGHFARTDFFASNDNASELKEGALAKIAQLAVGRVSFLLDSDTRSYPRRIFAGAAVPGVPYLLVTECPMSPLHEATLASLAAGKDAGKDAGKALHLAANAHTLFDMVYPNPASDALGLYVSTETPHLIAGASDQWKMDTGVIVETLESTGPVVTGPFLQAETLKHYSTKYFEMIQETLGAIRKGPGKIMIYHHRVHMSGVVQIAEILRMNGLIDEYSESGAATLCSVCGTQKDRHAGAAHAYAPARYALAHSDIDRNTMARSISSFNANTNREGYSIRVLVGSRIIKEGFNFFAVRHQFIMSLPVDYPTLIQVFGRVVRKASHGQLPPDQRNVVIRVFISTYRDKRTSPELQRYMSKGREYLIIQEVERALRQSAVDTFVNERRVRTILNSDAPTIDGLPLAWPAPPAGGPSRTETYYAYNYAEREIDIVVSVCRALFASQSVWTYGDLLAAVRSRPVHSIEYDLSKIDEGNFAAALEILVDRAGAVALAGRFYVRRQSGGPPIDYGSYLPDALPGAAARPAAPPPSTVDLKKYMQRELASKNFATYLKEFESTYLGEMPTPIEMSLIDYGAAFHYQLLQQLVEAAQASPPRAVTSDDSKVVDLYLRFKIIVMAAGRPGGYVSDRAVHIYTPNQADAWKSSLPLQALGISRWHVENDVIVGFIVSVGDQRAAPNSREFAAASSEAKFKIRPPIQLIGAVKDLRSVSRGAVCITRPRPELMKYIQQLRARAMAAQAAIKDPGDGPSSDGPSGVAFSGDGPSGPSGVAFSGDSPSGPSGARPSGRPAQEPRLYFKTMKNSLDYAVKNDSASFKRFPSANELCSTLRIYLLALEEHARSAPNGMAKGLRWLYLFNDALPALGADRADN